MTNNQAYQAGLARAEEIDRDGDFTEKELADRDSFVGAMSEIEANGRQFAGDVTEDFRREAEWDAYENGLSAGFAMAANRRFKTA